MKTLFFIFILLSSFLYANIINVPTDQGTIQLGIDAAANGDTVLVQPGYYFENINFNGKLITVGSLFLTTHNPTYISTTIIIGTSSVSVVTFNHGEVSSAVLCGFTIAYGSASGIYPENCGGGINCNNYSSPSLENLTITANSASGFGGGVYCGSFSSPYLNNVAITGNSASSYGGGLECELNSSPYLLNVTITGNSAGDGGGGLDCYGNSNPSLDNVTISDNSAGTNGGGIYCGASSPSLVNCILWNDSPQEIFIAAGSVTATYSDIQGGWTGTGNIDTDPLFVDPGNEDYHLQLSSPCIDAGDPASPLDPDGTIADMGAYFFNQYEGPVWHISTTGSDLTGSGSEQYPFATIQHGVNASSNTDTVLVQPGTYVENIIYNGKLIAVASLFLTTNDTTYISSTIIDGDSTESVVTFESGEDSTTVLCGFTIINGLGGGSPDYSGGGITCINSSSPSLQNLTITGNSANYHGGGISCWDYSSPSLQNLTITGNSANYGGGIYCSNYSNPSLVNITITGNSAVESGGGISCGNYSSPSLQNVTITGNTASGGYLCGGGGIYCSGSSPSLENVTITGNTVNNHGGGIYCRSDSHPVLINSILWGNAQMEIYIYISGSVTATYSDIEGGWTGTGNINADPLFIDPGNNNYYLLYISPCIDTGDPASPLDPDGTIADMGAYYFDRSPGAPAITAVTDVPDDQGRCVHVIWNRSPYDAPGSPVPIESYSVWRYDDIFGDRGIFEIYEDPREIFEEASKDNDKNYYWQRDDEILTFITQLPAMGLVQYSIISPTLKDSSVVSINYSAFKVFAHTDVTLIYFPSFPDSGYSVDNIAPDETRVYIAQNGSNIGLTWDEVEYGTFQGNSYPELNGIWYRIYAGDSPDFVCGEAHLVDIVTDLNYDYPLMSEEKKFFKIVVSDQPGAGRTINQFAPLGPVRRSLGVGGKGRKPRFIGAEGFK